MKFQMTELLSTGAAVTVRLGAGTGAGNNVDSKETSKFVKLVADSRYDLCAIGDAIEGFIESVEPATQDGYTIGAVRYGGRKTALAEGSQAAGTGSIAVGDFVVAGTPSVKGTAIPTFPNVRKATFQPFAAEAGALTDVNDMVKNAMFAWRVVSILVGTGAVGDTLVIERVNYVG